MGMELRYIALLLLAAILAKGVPISKRDQGAQCSNVYPECPEWKRNGMCEQNRDYMTATCPITCGFCNELTDVPDDDQNSESSGFAEETEEESGSTPQITSGDKKSKKEEDENKAKQSEDDEKEDEKKFGDKATEQERTENAEKYEDEEKQAEKGAKPVQQRSHGKKTNLMEKMLDSGELQAVAVTKGKARQKVPAHHKDGGDEEEDEEEDATNVDLDFKGTGLESFSGSGDDGKMHLTLRQNFNQKYQDKNSPAFKILSGNFEKDMMDALGDENSVSGVTFSEAEVEGNPKTSGKVRVNFNFDGDYKRLEKVVKSGSVNGLLVVKNSLEGPMLNLEEDE